MERRALVVVGAGFIGLEVAATAHALGCSVTVLEAAEAPLIRGLGTAMGRATTSLHDGIAIRCGVTVERLQADGVLLAGGEWVPADVVVVGVGVAPVTDWLDGSGLELRDGVVCDPTLARGRARGVRRRGSGPLAERAVRRGDAGRALDQRRRAGSGGRPQPARHRGRRRRHAPTRRCRSSGATRLRTGSSCSAAAAMTTTSRWRWPSARPPTAGSWPSTAGAAASAAPSGSTRRGW